MKTMLCARCGELVPQGCCTCGPRQELVETGSKWPCMMEVMGKELGRMLEWHNMVIRWLSFIPSPSHIDQSRAAYNAWKEWRR